MAKLIGELGYDVGVHDYNANEPPYAGMEAPEINAINEGILQLLIKNEQRFPVSKTIDRLADLYSDPMRAVTVEFPKDPRFCYTLPVWHVVDPIELVVVCVRDIEIATQSAYESKRQRHSLGSFENDMLEMAARLGYLIAFLETENISYVTLAFSKMVYDARYVGAKLKPHLKVAWNEIMEAHERIAQPELVHYV